MGDEAASTKSVALQVAERSMAVASKKKPVADYSQLPPGRINFQEVADYRAREVINPLPGKPEGTRQHFKAKIRHNKMIDAQNRTEPLKKSTEYLLLKKLPKGPAKKVLLNLMKEEDKAEAEASAAAEAAAAAAGVDVSMIKAQKVVSNKTALDFSGQDLSSTSPAGINAIILIGSILQHSGSLSALK